MASKSTATVLVTLIAALSAACQGNSSPLVPDGTPPPGATQACRTYATDWTTTSTFGAPTTSSASFNETDRTYREFSPAGSSQVYRRVTYATVADFVDEAATFARFLNQRAETCQARSFCSGDLNTAIVETPTYDRQRRRNGLTMRIRGVPLFVDDYREWDAQGRPTRGTRSEPQCTSTVVLKYNDDARTVSIGPEGPGSGLFCIGLAFAMEQTFDADGNVIAERGFAGGTSTTLRHTITATARVCK